MNLPVERLETYRRPLMIYGLAGMLLLAGGSKFVVLNQWIGYTPGWAVNLLPVGAATIMHVSSVFEIGLAVGLVAGWKRYVWAGLAAVWLAGITFMTGMAGFYDVAIRDLGLVVFAAVVTIETLPEE